MRLLALNLLLALLWAALNGELTIANLIFGFALGYLALLIAHGRQRGSYFRKVPQTFAFIGFLLRELTLSGLRVAHDAVTRARYMRPAVLGIPLEAKTDAEITLLSHLLSLTPGSLTLELSPDRKTLYVHLMFVDDYERARERMKSGFERRVLDLLR